MIRHMHHWQKYRVVQKTSRICVTITVCILYGEKFPVVHL